MTLKFDEEVPRNEQLSHGDVTAIGRYFARMGRGARSAMGGMLEVGGLYNLDHEENASSDPAKNPYGASTVAEHRQRKQERRTDRAAYSEVREPWEEADPFEVTARPMLGSQHSQRDVEDFVDEEHTNSRLNEVLRVDPVAYRALTLYCHDEGHLCDGSRFGRLLALFPTTPAGGELLRREHRKSPVKLSDTRRLLNVLEQKKLDPITREDLTKALAQAKTAFRKACALWNDTFRG